MSFTLFDEDGFLTIDGAFHVIARCQEEDSCGREPRVCDVLAGAGERYHLFFDTMGETGDPFPSPEEAWAYVHRFLIEADARPADPMRPER